MALLNAHTSVDANATIGQIMQLLGKAGATEVRTTYANGSVPVGLDFTLQTPAGLQTYRLPVKIERVQANLQRDFQNGSVRRIQTTREHAAKVAWRILKDWLQAQFAIVETGMVTTDEVLLPYLKAPSGQTVYEAFAERNLMLPSGRT